MAVTVTGKVTATATGTWKKSGKDWASVTVDTGNGTATFHVAADRAAYPTVKAIKPGETVRIASQGITFADVVFNG